MLNSLSNYHLVFELLHEGKGNIHPELEPMDTNEIIVVLENRAKRAFGKDIKSIINWYLNSEGIASEKEKEGIAIVLKLKKIEKKYLTRLKKKGFDI